MRRRAAGLADAHTAGGGREGSEGSQTGQNGSQARSAAPSPQRRRTAALVLEAGTGGLEAHAAVDQQVVLRGGQVGERVHAQLLRGLGWSERQAGETGASDGQKGGAASGRGDEGACGDSAAAARLRLAIARDVLAGQVRHALEVLHSTGCEEAAFRPGAAGQSRTGHSHSSHSPLHPPRPAPTHLALGFRRPDLCCQSGVEVVEQQVLAAHAQAQQAVEEAPAGSLGGGRLVNAKAVGAACTAALPACQPACQSSTQAGKHSSSLDVALVLAARRRRRRPVLGHRVAAAAGGRGAQGDAHEVDAAPQARVQQARALHQVCRRGSLALLCGKVERRAIGGERGSLNAGVSSQRAPMPRAACSVQGTRQAKASTGTHRPRGTILLAPPRGYPAGVEEEVMRCRGREMTGSASKRGTAGTRADRQRRRPAASPPPSSLPGGSRHPSLPHLHQLRQAHAGGQQRRFGHDEVVHSAERLAAL